MPWQTQAYYDGQRKTLRPGTYLRLHENRWATAEEIFITPEMWNPGSLRPSSQHSARRVLPVWPSVKASNWKLPVFGSIFLLAHSV